MEQMIFVYSISPQILQESNSDWRKNLTYQEKDIKFENKMATFTFP